VDVSTESASGALDTEVYLHGQSALIIGLGVGVAGSAFTAHGLDLDVVEIDPAVYRAAVDHFGFTMSNASTVNLMDGAAYIRHLAALLREGTYKGDKWSYVIQDCFSGGSVPGELFTVEFWTELSQLVEVDGIVAVVSRGPSPVRVQVRMIQTWRLTRQNFAGIVESKASRAVLVTLLSVFTQCRAFGDGFYMPLQNLINMVSILHRCGD
jgi:spermidine synthase